MLSEVLHTSSVPTDRKGASKMALKARKPRHLGRRPITWAEPVAENGVSGLFGACFRNYPVHQMGGLAVHLGNVG
jgi:hypothetical protein